MKKTITKFMLLAAFALAIGSACVACAGPPKKSPGWPKTDDPVALAGQSIANSAVKVEQKFIINTKALRDKGADIEPFLESGGSGSGVVIAVNKDRWKGGHAATLVVTAHHVCEEAPFIEYDLIFFTVKMEAFNYELDVVTHDGTKLAARIYFEDKENDLCLIEVDGIAGVPAPVAKTLPSPESPVMYAGAPKGEWGPYLVPVMDGRFTGVNGDGFIVFTTPVAPGASGSGLFYRGELIGIVTMVNREFHNLGYGIHLKHVLELAKIAKHWTSIKS